ncbi:MAG: hypothetical protein P8163_02415 [Candidatus Thiodiazotropha sp.]
MNKRTLYKLNAYTVSLLFLALIFTALMVSVIEEDASVSKAEKRRLSGFPPLELRVGSIKKFPGRFDDYFSDHFGGREWLSSTYRKLKYALGDSPSKDVTLGKDGWLFLGSIKKGYTHYGDPIGDIRNVNLYSEDGLRKLATYMMAMKQWLHKQGIEYLFVLAPNKHTIYTEKLPDYITKVNQRSSADQLVEYLKNHTDIKVVDLRQPLLDKKEEHLLYKRTGTHWNHYAVNIAQYEIMQAVQQFYPKAVNPRIFELKDQVKHSGGDLASMIGNREFQELAPIPIFKNTCRPVKKPKHAKETETFTVTCEGKKLSLMIFRDSFFNDIKQYFSRQINRTTYIWGKLDFAILKQHLERQKTDLVIEEMVERKLPYIPRPISELNMNYETITQSNSK